MCYRAKGSANSNRNVVSVKKFLKIICLFYLIWFYTSFSLFLSVFELYDLHVFTNIMEKFSANVFLKFSRLPIDNCGSRPQVG